MKTDTGKELAALEKMTTGQLRAKYQVLFGVEAGVHRRGDGARRRQHVARNVARKDLLCAALSVSLPDAISFEDGGVGVYAALCGGKRTLGHGWGKAVL